MIVLRDIKKRISAIESTMKITGALKIISAAKLRTVQENAVSSRTYNDSIKQMTLKAAQSDGQELYSVFEPKKRVRHITIVVIAPEKGFCGALSDQIYKQVKEYSDILGDRDVRFDILVAGKKGSRYFKKKGMVFEKIDVAAEDPLAGIKVENISRSLLRKFISGKTDQVMIAYNEFLSAVSHRVEIDIFLPIWEKNSNKKNNEPLQYIFEPSRKEVLEKLIIKKLRTTLFQALLEARASELSARIIAMEKALSSGKDMVESLTRKYHRVRQSVITGELMDIVGGSEALNDR